MASVYEKRATWYLNIKDATGLRRNSATKATTKTEARRLAADLERQGERARIGREPLPSSTTTCAPWSGPALPRPRSRSSAFSRAGMVIGHDHDCRCCKARRVEPHAWRHQDQVERKCQRCGMWLWPSAPVVPNGLPLSAPHHVHPAPAGRRRRSGNLLASGVAWPTQVGPLFRNFVRPK